MQNDRMIPDHKIYLWSFDAALGGVYSEYVKAYYHTLDGLLSYHMHDFYEINIIIGGSGKHFIEDREIIARKGDIFVIPPGVKHGYSCNGRMTVYHILLSNRFMSSFAPFLEKLSGYKMLFDVEPILRSRLETPYYLRSDTMDAESVKRYIEMIEYGGGMSESQTERAFHVLSLIADMSKRMNHLSDLNGRGVAEDRVLTIIGSMEHIEKKFAERLDFKELASRCAISYSTYLRLFGRLTGTTPAEYQMRCRIKKASELLLSGDESVLSVALSCGFYDSSHFIREFTKRKGISPSRFRNEELER